MKNVFAVLVLYLLHFSTVYSQKGYFESFEKGIKIGVNWVDLSNNKRSLVLPAVYDHLYFLQQDMVRIDSNGFIGVYNLAKRRYELPFGQEKINLYGKKEAYNEGNENFVIVKNKQHFGCYQYNNSSLSLLIPFEYDSITYINDSVCGLVKGEKMGAFHLYKQQLIAPVNYLTIVQLTYKEEGFGNYVASKFNNQFFVLSENGNRSLIDETGKIIIPEGIQSFSLKEHYIEKTSKIGIQLVDFSGKTGTNSYEKLDSYGSLIKAKKEGVWGVIRPDERILVPFKYDSLLVKCNAEEVKSAPIEEFNILGMNKNGLDCYDFATEKTPISFPNTQIKRFYFRQIILEKNGKQGCIDFKGKVIVPFDYEWIQFWFEQNKKDALTGKKGKQIYFLDNKGNNYDSIQGDSLSIADASCFKLTLAGKQTLVPTSTKKIPATFADEIIASPFTATKYARNGDFFTEVSYDMSAHAAPFKIEQKGFSSFDSLAFEIVRVLKSEDDEQLRELVAKITPDTWDLSFAMQNNVDYRNVFKQFSTYNYHTSISTNFQVLLDLRELLKKNNQLTQLRTCGFDYNVLGTIPLSKSLSATATEAPLILFAGETQIRFKVGELIVLNGRIKTFTKMRILH